jgi:hypothetical protein
LAIASASAAPAGTVNVRAATHVAAPADFHMTKSSQVTAQTRRRLLLCGLILSSEACFAKLFAGLNAVRKLSALSA